MRCANFGIVEGSELLGKGQGFLETALDEAEQARSSLSDENTTLRHWILSAVNKLQSILHQMRLLHSESELEVREAAPQEKILLKLFLVARAFNSLCPIPPVSPGCCTGQTGEYTIRSA